MNPAVKKLLRWIALPFAVAAVYLLNHVAIILLFYLQTFIFKTNIDSYNIFFHVLAPGFAAYFAVGVAWQIAPVHKFIAAMSVFTLLVFVMGAAFVSEAATAGVWRLANIVVHVIAGGYALWNIMKVEKRAQSKTETV